MKMFESEGKKNKLLGLRKMFLYVNEGTRKKEVPGALGSPDVPLEPYIVCPAARMLEQSFIQGISLLPNPSLKKRPHTE